MSKNLRILWITFSLVLAFTMVISAVVAEPVESATEQPMAQRPLPERPDRPLPVGVPDGIERIDEVPMEMALEKLDPLLREAAQTGGKELHKVYVSVQDSADIGQYLTDIIERPAVFGGIRNIYGQTTAANLLKIAQQSGVLAVVAVGIELDKPFNLEQNIAPDLGASMAALQAGEVTYAEATALANDVGSAGWFDVQDGHKSSAAWEKGFTGEGVVVGVLDDGIDFAHPDLQGTSATVTDPDSPYYGWPMAFSYVSMLNFVNEVNFQTFGAYGITQNWNGSRWADSQHTVEASSPFDGGEVTGMYTPIGSGVAYEYTVTGTSASGFYKFGSHPERNLRSLYGHDVAILVVDENVPGVYDTVYVDLDNDKDFTDEKPVTQDSPEVYRDMDGDGYADISGGLLVWISDGENVPPTADWLWGVQCGDEVGTLKACPDSGELLLFAGPFDGGYTHGTQCASNIAGQGVVNGGLTAQPFYEGGSVVGGAPDVGLMDFGNHYYSGTDEDEFLVASLGYDGIANSGDEVQITSNSYGNFRQMWGGWGYFGRLITSINMTIAPSTVWVFSAGNEGPGFGPQEGDGGPTTIQVGSSTQYGSTNWDSIASSDQIMFGDPNSFFSKGPNRDGSSGLDVLGNGGRGSGDEGLNYYGFNGAESWATWGGTSRSGPVAAGNLALVYQAYKDRYGEWPTWEEAKALLKSGATNSISSPFFQGGGVVNADRATDLAAGIYGVYAMPDEWQVGDWEGVDYLNFANVAYAGQTYTKTYEVHNPSGYDITVDASDGVMTMMGSHVFTFTTSDESEESDFNFHSPDYLMELDASIIPADAELMVVRYIHPYDTFEVADPDTGEYAFDGNPSSSWRFMVYNWTDMNGDNMLWEDTNNNGVVNHVDDMALGPDNDGFYRPDYSDSDTEIQEGEYVRVDYEFGGLAVPIAIHDPQERMADGYYFGWQHRNNDHTISQTTFQIGVEFYKRADWDWLALSDASVAVPAEGMAVFTATMSLSANAAPGAYEGVVFLSDPGDNYHDAHETALPVVVNVIADLADDSSVTLGGGAMADTLYQNSYTYGTFNWYGGGWTGAGDWRHYFLNIDEADVANGNMLVHTSWDSGYPTDINTHILGPTYDCASNGFGPCVWYGQSDQSVFGPYTLLPIAGSEFSSGATYAFNTSTGGPDDWMMAPMGMDGLYEIALHNVLYDGEDLAAQLEVNVGTIGLDASIDPVTGEVYLGSIDADVYTETGSFDVEFTPTLELPDLEATLTGGLVTTFYGWFSSFVPDTGGCFTAWCPGNVYEYIQVLDAGATELYVYLDTPSTQDIDMFLVYDADDNGIPEQGIDTVVGSSGNSAGDPETILLNNPTLGGYFVVLDGYDVEPDSGIWADWYYTVTAPGDLPTDPTFEVTSTVTISQDDKFDPTDASYSKTFTAGDHDGGLNASLYGIPVGNDVDLYVTDAAGDIVASSQNTSNTDEFIEIAPMAGEYRFAAGETYTVWVHGFDVPTSPITPTLDVWWDTLNIWLSATDPDVHVNAIDPGETVAVTVNFDKENWDPGDPPLAGRLIAGPSVMPGAFDEFVTITRVNQPVHIPDAAFSKSVESDRGPSPYLNNGYPTALANTGDTLTFTLRIENTDAVSTTTFYAEDWMLPDWEIFGGFVVTPTNYSIVSSVPWDILVYTTTLAPGEVSEVVYTTTFTNSLGVTGWAIPNYFDVYEDNSFYYYGGDINYAYIRSFRTTGSYKTDYVGVVAPGDTYTYTVSLANPSSEDGEVMVVDELPEEVDFVSATGGLAYDANTHTLTWDGDLPGSSLSTVDFEVTVTVKADVEDGTWIDNTAYVYNKYMNYLLTTLWTSTYVDDGLSPDIEVEKTVDSLMQTVGEKLAYTIVATNNGNETATGAAITDTIPAELDIDMSSISGATYDDGMLVWEGDLAAGESVTITFEATISETTPANLALINAAIAAAENHSAEVYNSAVTEVRGLTKIYLPIIFR
ncbi:MAG: DUF11 domain-containing protein [Chloroflexi bacterium]|nr:DUF11 domain-containing protein [Chloroflexota bacterium]